MSVWFVERDMSGYDYLLLEIFSNEQAAAEYAALLRNHGHVNEQEIISVREVLPLDVSPAGYVDPICWGPRK